jgi:DNA-binding NarL/FixJ family response regulator
MAVKILIADDHDVIREGIKSILSKETDYKVIGEASDGEEVIQKVKELKPDILLLDITMPKRSGLDLIRQVHYLSPSTKIVIITMHRANIYIDKALKLGVKGYLLKENVVEDLIPALRRIERGEYYISSKATEYLVERVTQEKEYEIGGVTLSERERDVLRLVVEGKTAKEIARLLFISPRTVENYKNNLLKKFGFKRTSDLIKYAIKQKLFDVE